MAITHRRLLAAATVVLATATIATPAHAAVLPRLDGVWRTDGYGQYVTVEGRELRRFDVTAVSCAQAAPGRASGGPSPSGAVRFAVANDDAVTLRPTSATSAREHLESATSHRLLSRVAALPTRCTRPGASDPRSIFDEFWSTFAENYPFFTERGVDWAALRARYRDRVTASTTPRELFAVFAQMLRPLRDAHVALIGLDDRVVSSTRPGTAAPTSDLDARLAALVRTVDLPSVGASGLVKYARGRISFARLSGRIGYLRVSGFTGYTGADTEAANRAELNGVLDTIFASTTQQRGLLVDLRVNGGGSDALALELARRLASRPYFAYAKQYRTSAGGWSAPQPRVVRPSSRPGYRAAVTLLTSGSTVSAGETFVQAMLSRRPSVVRVGEATQGVFSDTLQRTLANGWQLMLPNEQYLSASGEAFDVRGIPATVPAPFVTSGKSDPLFTTAYETLRSA